MRAQFAGDGRGADAFGDVADQLGDGLPVPPGRQVQADLVVTAERAGASGDQVAQAGQAGEGQGLAPAATPSRAISARPRVINAERASTPMSRPSATPVAMAIQFFRAPPYSTPVTSELV